MFLSKLSSTRTRKHAFRDLTSTRDVDDWHPGVLRVLHYHLDVVAIAYDPVLGLLAVGTTPGIIRIFGAPGVDVTLDLPEPLPISILRISTSSRQLVCVDERNRLHIWDLNQSGPPQHQKTVVFGCAISDICLSPSHTHALIALQTGEIRTYDLLSLQTSPYKIPNIWRLRHDSLNQPISPPQNQDMEIPVEIISHPRELNQIFVVYAGGVVLYDLLESAALAVYERLNSIDNGDDPEHHEELARPCATSIAIHPAGHFFVVGYTDGLVAFWAIADEKRPLFVGPIAANCEGQDIECSGSDQSLAPADLQCLEREPLYNLTWCGFPSSDGSLGGETALFVLGGGLSGSTPGLEVYLMPAFNATLSPQGEPGPLHQIVRDAMTQTLVPKKTIFISTSSAVRNFCIVPRESPHFSAAWDPVAVICICDTPLAGQIVEAQRFPPPQFFVEDRSHPPSSSESDVIDHLGELLEEMRFGPTQQGLRLPNPLKSNLDGIVRAYTIALENETMENLSRGSTQHDGLTLHGGAAWIDATRLAQAKLSKYQPQRLLITVHRDARVQFYDISPRLLISTENSPMQTDFPRSFSDLTINVGATLADPQLDEDRELYCNPEVLSVQFSRESLECSVALKSGEVLVYYFQPQNEGQRAAAELDESVVLFNAEVTRGSKFSPYMMLRRQPNQTTSCSLSDIGFLAVGYANGVVVVVDLRGPFILHVPQTDHSGNVNSRRFREPEPTGEVVSLTWTVSGLSSEPQLAVRLIAVHASGASYVYRLTRTDGSLSYSFTQVVTTDTLPNLLPNCSYVIDSNTGAIMHANREGFAAALQSKEVAPHSCFWVTANAQGAQCNVDITGDRIGMVNWHGKRKIVHASIVERSNSRSLVAFTEDEALIYTLPYLELLHHIPLLPRPTDPMSVDITGDFVYYEPNSASVPSSKLTLASLFTSRRVYDPPLVDLTKNLRQVPPQPQPITLGPRSLLASWFSSSKPVTGEQIDNLFAGPDRPVTELQLPSARNKDLRAESAERLSTAAGTENTPETNLHADLYGGLRSALTERGEMLGDLEQRIDSLGQGAQDMVNQAKRIAAEQGAKRWFGF